MHTSPTHLTTTRLHLLLASAAALTGVATGTVYGVATAVTVLALVVLRGWASAHLDARSGSVSGAVGARTLAGAEGRRVLQHTGHARQRTAH